MIQLYKRNNRGEPILWKIEPLVNNKLSIIYGKVNGNLHTEEFVTNRTIEAEIKTRVNAKRKEGYKELSELHDNSPVEIRTDKDLYNYLNTYLPKFNTANDGKILPMLAKTLEDDKPFNKGVMLGQFKINGVRCIIGAEKTVNDLFKPVRFTYSSREGVTWNQLSWMDDIILSKISDNLLQLMVEEGVCLDGELYLPGYKVNDINSFVKNPNLSQHYKLQYWCYDICVENMSYYNRVDFLDNNTNQENWTYITTKEKHLNNNKQFNILETFNITNITDATRMRDWFIDLGFEGLIVRNPNAEYQFGKRNSSMFKYKKILDGYFTIVDIIPEGKRKELPKFVCKNDINDELFECTINLPQSEQRLFLIDKDSFINKKMFIEYRERSGIKEVPFHAKGIKVII